MRRTFARSGLGLTVALALAGTTPASTEPLEPSGAKTVQEYDVKTPEGEVHHVKVWKRLDGPRRVPSEIVKQHQALAGAGCQGFTMGATRSDVFGNVLLSYSQRIDWCYDGTNVTWVTHSKTPAVYGTYIRFNGIIADNHSGGAGTPFFKAYSQADFCQFIPWGGCTWYVYPWVDQYVFGSGGTSGAAGS